MSKKDCPDCELYRRRYGAAAGLCPHCWAEHHPNSEYLSLRAPELNLKLWDELAGEAS
ncbi:hypothetical protein ACWDNI_35805 [Nocardia niigatensis]